MKNSLLKNIFYLTSVLSIVFALITIPWMPSSSLSAFIAFTSIIFLLWSTYPSITIILGIYNKTKAKYAKRVAYIISTFVTFIIGGAFILLFMVYMMMLAFGEVFIKSYAFEDKEFYLYDTGFMDNIIEVKMKIDYLPIRSASIAVISHENSDNISLKRNGDIIYLMIQDKPPKKIYDMNNMSVIQQSSMM